MDQIDKELDKMSAKLRQEIKKVLRKIYNDDLVELDVKKLKGKTDIYRVRKGKYRIIFIRISGQIKILALDRRSDTTYRF